MTSQIDVNALIDGRKLGRFQLTAIALCALVALMDGFDTQSIAFAAPAITEAWGVDRSHFGPIFSAALAGLAIGALLFGTVADRIGRKTVILGSIVVFGTFSLATAFAESLTTLLILRFITGLGLGGAIPNIIALTNEYAPRRLKVVLVALMASGFPLGGFLGGIISARLVPEFGWQSVFIVGGLIPLLSAPVLLKFLPESIPFLLHKKDRQSQEKVAKYMASIAPDVDLPEDTEFAMPTVAQPKSSVGGLFARGMALNTIMLWFTFFTNLLMFYFLASWIPTVLADAGVALNLAIIAAAILNAGTVVGGVVLGYLIDRFGPYKVLIANYIGAAAFVMLIGVSSGNMMLMYVLVCMAGFCVGGGQLAIVGFAASLYSTRTRSTGVGWAFGVGRCGAIAGPIFAGFLIAQAISNQSLFLAFAIPGVLAALAVFSISRANRKPVAEAA